MAHSILILASLWWSGTICAISLSWFLSYGRNLEPEIIFEWPVSCFSEINNELSSFLWLGIISVYHVNKLSGDGLMWIPLLSCFLIFNPIPVR